MGKVRVCVLRTAGTNCDRETASAFCLAGAEAELLHINRLRDKPHLLDAYQILAIPGGFTYGDDLGAGRILANEITCLLFDALTRFISQGKLIIGICNGFQVLVKAGILPGWNKNKQVASLVLNDSDKFEDRWVYLKFTFAGKDNICVWTAGLEGLIYLPVAHAEGKFITCDKEVLAQLKKNRQVVLQYTDEKGELAGYPYNPNGSEENIAGICDPSGRIFGLMPHPERHIYMWQHPRWQKENFTGLDIFRNGVNYIRKNNL